MRGSRLSGSALFVSLFYHLCVSASRRDALSTAYEKRYARQAASVTFFCTQHQSGQSRTQHNVCWDSMVSWIGLSDDGDQSRTQHYVCWDTVVPSLVPHGLRRRLGKSSVFRAVFAVKMRFSDERSHSRTSLFLVRCGLRRFGKTQRRNAVCASLWIIFHFASITKQYLFYHLCVASSRTTARFTAPRSVAPHPHPVSPSWSRCA